jgi:hypothetical protein
MIPPAAIKALLIAAVVVALGFAWNGFIKHEQNVGYQKAVAEYTVKLLEAKELADQRERALSAQVQEAQANGLKREETIRTLAAAVGKSSDSLRNTANAIRLGLPNATVEAARTAADAFATVFTDCQRRYAAVAESADGHANDVRTLEEAWPQ